MKILGDARGSEGQAWQQSRGKMAVQLEHARKRKRRVSTAAAVLNRQQQQPTSWTSCGCDSSGDASSCATRFWPVVTACMACAAQPAQGQLLRSSSGSIWGGRSAVERSNRELASYGHWGLCLPCHHNLCLSRLPADACT